jgi:uncharacterized protein YeaO (DUF488 family)
MEGDEEVVKFFDPQSEQWVEYTAQYQREIDQRQKRANRMIKNERWSRNREVRREANRQRAIASKSGKGGK